MSYQGEIGIAQTAADVRKAVGEWDEHSKSLNEMVALIEGLTLREGHEDVMGVGSSSARQLYLSILVRERPDEEVQKQMKALAKKLTYEEKLFPVAIDKLVRALELLYVTDDLIPGDWPMYLDPELLFDDSREFQILSAFGPTAPSLLDSVGQEFHIPKGIVVADPNSVHDATSHKRPLESILISMKKLSIAVTDARNVRQKRRIRQNQNERAAGFRTLRFTGGGRDRIWNTLRNMKYKSPIVEKGKGKRRLDDDEDEDREEGSSKKTRVDSGVVALDWDFTF
jgi:hypothetical protein